MKKRLLLFPIMILLLVTLVACGEKPVQTVIPESDTAAISKQEEIGGTEELTMEKNRTLYPVVLTDQAGREVTLEKKPESLVSCYYITTSAFLALELGDEIKGIETNPERRPIYKRCNPKLLEQVQVGSPKELDLEACASIHPDLVVLPMRAKDMVDSFEQLGIPVLVVNPESQEEVLEMLQLLAIATDRQERGQELVGFIREKVEELQKRLEGCEKPSVYLGGNSSFLSTASKGMYQNSLITMAGARNVAEEIDDTYWVESSYEQILAWDPQVIVMASDAKYSEEEVRTDANLESCQALKEGKIYQIPSDAEAWDSPVPASFLGAIYLASVLHSDIITTDEYKTIVEEYYEKFYGFSYAEK